MSSYHRGDREIDGPRTPHCVMPSPVAYLSRLRAAQRSFRTFLSPRTHFGHPGSLARGLDRRLVVHSGLPTTGEHERITLNDVISSRLGGSS